MHSLHDLADLEQCVGNAADVANYPLAVKTWAPVSVPHIANRGNVGSARGLQTIARRQNVAEPSTSAADAHSESATMQQRSSRAMDARWESDTGQRQEAPPPDPGLREPLRDHDS